VAGDPAEMVAALKADSMLLLAIAESVGAERGCLPQSEVTEICKEYGPALGKKGGPAVLEAFTACLLTRDVDAAIEWLDAVGFLPEYLPELTATRDLTQEAGRHHKDVWEHTKLVVRQAVRRPALRWGALLHDIGKTPTRTFTNKGVHFHGHAEVGARMFDRVGRRIPFERPMRRKLRFLIRHHLRAAQYSPQWTDSAVRRFDREMGEHLGDLLDLSRADITSKRPGRRQAILRQLSLLWDRIEALRAADAVVSPLSKGIGTTIMTHFELPPSKLIGDVKRALEAAIEAGELEGGHDDDYYVRWLESENIIDPLQARYQNPQ